MSMDIVYFDLETQRTANDVGGWHRKDAMGMSVGVTFSSRQKAYTIYPEHRVQNLIDQLCAADLVVGFNVIDFDYAVLMGYTILDLPSRIRTLDLLADLESKVKRKIKLETFAQATLGFGKTAEGLEAIKWWREGRLMEVAEYCCFDVKVTKLLHEFGAREGRVFFEDRNQIKHSVEVDWKNAP